jgi:hypothetical protein
MQCRGFIPHVGGCSVYILYETPTVIVGHGFEKALMLNEIGLQVY